MMAWYRVAETVLAAETAVEFRFIELIVFLVIGIAKAAMTRAMDTVTRSSIVLKPRAVHSCDSCSARIGRLVRILQLGRQKHLARNIWDFNSRPPVE